MIHVQIQITRIVDYGQPWFVECELVDAFGRKWIFLEKEPVVNTADSLNEADLPSPGVIAGHIVDEETDSAGRRIITIDTEKPWGIEAVTGERRFDVLPEQIVVQ